MDNLRIRDIATALGVSANDFSRISSGNAHVYSYRNQAVIKAYDAKIFTTDHVRFISRVIETFSQLGFVVPTGARLNQKGPIEIAPGFILHISKYVGEKDSYRQKRAVDGFLNPEHLRTCAQLLANFHRASSSLEWQESNFCPEFKYPTFRLGDGDLDMLLDRYQFLSFRDSDCQIRDQLIAKARSIHDHLSSQMRCLRVGMIHNDMIPRNVVFDKDEKAVGLVDFDYCKLAPFVVDLAWTLDYIGYPRNALKTLDVDGRMSSMRSFVSSYLERFMLSGPELQLLTWLIPGARFEYAISVANYHMSLGDYSAGIVELRWLVEYLATYERHPFELGS
jgi:thiamine kinase-like enzyme